ncbi:hypothetical protein B0T22DRAFT_99089 [Podospora appendiculata]|uniref:Transmembrane protein n=1 Tax=Podospora appendiculata TaxID=314037 RepID=A0AAE1CI01_9PEZI|nr:hypothetical protein B0T22DRAFT_99089 [Podospora appendiculata]
MFSFNALECQSVSERVERFHFTHTHKYTRRLQSSALDGHDHDHGHGPIGAGFCFLARPFSRCFWPFLLLLFFFSFLVVSCFILSVLVGASNAANAPASDACLSHPLSSFSLFFFVFLAAGRGIMLRR